MFRNIINMVKSILSFVLFPNIYIFHVGEGDVGAQPAVITIDNYNNVNIVGPSRITQRLMFAAAAAANTSAAQTCVNVEGANVTDNLKDDAVLDAATRQAQVAATAAAFLKSMEADELLHVVPEEGIMHDSPPQRVNDNDNADNNINIDGERNFLRNSAMNQIHDDLYRQLTGT